jgi:hypothetical protein
MLCLHILLYTDLFLVAARREKRALRSGESGAGRATYREIVSDMLLWDFRGE